MTEQPQEAKPVMSTGSSPAAKPALTVVIQSWWTPALAVIMLVVGLLAGYFGGQLLHRNSPANPVAAVVTQSSSTPQVTAGPTATMNPTQAAQVDQMMKDLISQTTNFMGDPNAKVTLIEFSDYQ